MTIPSSRRVALSALSVVTAIAAGVLLIRLAGASPFGALRALASGSAGSTAAIGETLTRAAGLVLTALAAVVAFRAGVLNIGIDGQLLAGAAAAAALGPLLTGLGGGRTVVLVASAGAGAVAVLPAAWLAERRRVPAVLSTILLNLVAAAMVTWLVRGPLRDPAGDYPQTRPLPDSMRLQPLLPGIRSTSAVLWALLAAAAVASLLGRTSLGLRLRAVGAAPEAARAMGLPDVGLRLLAFCLSGALAGLAGGLEVVAVTGRLYDPFATGMGYVGITAALLGNTTPSGGAASALLFAALGAGSAAMQRDTGVPSPLATVVPALLVLGLLAARSRWTREGSR